MVIDVATLGFVGRFAFLGSIRALRTVLVSSVRVFLDDFPLATKERIDDPPRGRLLRDGALAGDGACSTGAGKD